MPMAEERPLQSVLDRIVEGSRSRTDEIMKDARVQSQDILKRSSEEDRARKEAALRSASERSTSEATQQISSARLESKKAILEGRRKALDELREMVLSHLNGQSNEDRRKLLLRLIDRASSVIPKGSVRCSEMDEPILREVGRYSIAGRIDPPGGIVVIDTTGERVLDLRLVTLVDMAMESSYEEIESILFGE
jgi:V/A-type H+-transporting ATPase subunit E